MHTALVISPHADDAATHCGGTITKWADAGWNMILVRVTDDSKSGVGISEDEAVERNRSELLDAAAIMGCGDVEELAFPTGSLADVPLSDLREQFVYLFRQYRPYAVFSFDPSGLFETNMDHVRVAQAVEEAYWAAACDLYHPEHFQRGLTPYSVCERWYFARRLPETNYAEDISNFIDIKVRALAAHHTMMRSLINQARLQLQSCGRNVTTLDEALEGDFLALVRMVVRQQAAVAAKAAKYPEGRFAEQFRVVRFGELEGVFQVMSQPLPGVIAPVRRAFLGDEE